jgi:hypothetical protein
MSKTNDLQIQKDEAIGEILDIMNKHKIYMNEIELAYTDGVIKNYPWDKGEYRVVPSKQPANKCNELEVVRECLEKIKNDSSGDSIVANFKWHFNWATEALSALESAKVDVPAVEGNEQPVIAETHYNPINSIKPSPTDSQVEAVEKCIICEMQRMIDEMPDNIDYLVSEFLAKCKKGQREYLKPLFANAILKGRRIGYKEGKRPTPPTNERKDMKLIVTGMG